MTANKKRALITGVGGQDGSYLAKFLLDKGYEVIGTSRNPNDSTLKNLSKLGVLDLVEIKPLRCNDYEDVRAIICSTKPDEIYNLAGQSSVGLSFERPIDTFESNSLSVLYFLEAIRTTNISARFYNAGTGECFGDTGDLVVQEDAPFKPFSPYAVAKVAAHNLVSNYRNSYNIFSCTGVLFNHESPLRPESFVTQKIIHAAYRIKNGSKETLFLGNIDICRDWGWAPEYVKAMWLMLQQDVPSDFIIATGKSVSLKYFLNKVFLYFELDWRKYVEINPALMRASDVKISKTNPERALQNLNWNSEIRVDQVIVKMCECVNNLNKKNT